MGEGRFGPLFHAHDAAGLSVVIRTFVQPFSDSERTRLHAALEALCRAPLDHPAIARPLACGIEQGRPYLVHSYLPGTSLADLVTAQQSPALRDLLVRLTHVAAALDFAAATGVVHGALSARDIILDHGAAGVAGFGLVQALENAGIPGFHARRDDDLRALADITRDLTGVEVPGTFLTALEFAGALQRTVTTPAVVAAPAPEPMEFAFDDESGPTVADVPVELDIPIRDTPTLAVPDFAPAMFGAAAVAEPARSYRWLIVPAALLIIIAVGVLLGSGFLGDADRVETAKQVPQAAAAPSPEPVAPSLSEPESAGRTYTDAAVDDGKPPQAAASAPAPAPAPSPAPERQAPRRPSPRATAPAVDAPRSGPAAMRVDSRPVGAQVFVDGKSVGYTPLVVADLVPGTHSVRMQIPGYRPWVTAVTLAPGARERVAASLEQ